MDYQGDFQDMIARYNRELLHTYQKRATNPEPPQAEPVSAVALPEDTRPRYPVYEQNEPTWEEEKPPVAITPPTSADTTPVPMELGYLQVWVTTASSAVPVEGAHVTVSYNSSGGEQRTVQYIGVTDVSGRTESIPLPAVTAQASLSPEGNPTPFTLYNIEVFADGYYRVENLGVPMYGGVRAIQPVRMIPLPEGTVRNDPLVYRDSAPQGLEESV